MGPEVYSAYPLNFASARTVEDIHRYFEANRELCAPNRGSEQVFAAKCYVCRGESLFDVDQPGRSANWRETLRCQGCGLINRWRSCFHLFEQICRPTETSKVFITEAITPLHDLIADHYPSTIGSEFSPAAEPGEWITIGRRNVRMEDVTRLSFPNLQFDAVLCFDVLEHVPDYRQALREFCRVLRSGGHVLLSVPFTFRAQTQIRAQIAADGSVHHLLPPEYHGDPVSRSGVLCYRTFGMDLLAEMEAAGFGPGYVACYASAEWAYLGANILFVAQKVE